MWNLAWNALRPLLTVINANTYPECVILLLPRIWLYADPS